ncbi:MAG: DapH/DapD/GlmU-related protein [Planctomycetota bacterium]|nr:DapH/DapD/GlmU-related protein [Planctomycetota bacterium]
MLSDDDRRRIKSEKRAFRDWWAGDRREPFVLPRRENYGVCAVILPGPLANLALGLRYVAMLVIGRMLTSWVRVRLYRLMGVRIGRGVYIAPGVFLDAFYPRLIELEDGCFLGIGCRLLAHEYTTAAFRVGRVRIGKGSVIGGWSIVRSGVTVGRGVTTGLGSVVVADVPDGLTVGGVPAKPLKGREYA